MPGTTPPQAPSTAPSPSRQGLPAYLVVLIVLDVLLLAVAVWMGVSRAGGSSTDGSSPDASVTSTTSPDGSEPSAAPPIDIPSADATLVASPTGNITCAIAPTGVRCAIAALAAEPAPVAGCDGTVGYVVELSSAGVSTPCVAAADQPAAAGADVPVLEYGSSRVVNNFGCESTQTGMRCTDATTGAGFTLARAGVTRS